MLSNLYKKFSLNNLMQDEPKGQIATLLILIIVVILTLILITVNLGQLSLTSTNIANVADSSALYLASQLANRSHSIYQAIGGVRRCESGGFGGLFGAIIGAAIAIGVTIAFPAAGPAAWGAAAGLSTAGTIVAAGAIGGAIGGGVGASISGTNVTQGVFQGAMIGAAIGGGAALGAEGGAGAAESGLGVADKAAIAEMQMSGLANEAALAAMNQIAVSAAVGATAGGALAIGSSVYNATVADQNQSAAFAAAARMLNGIPDYDRFRESVVLQALSQTVDDPTKVLDYQDAEFNDLNGNGITNESVPRFLYWWAARVKGLQAVIAELKIPTKKFFYETSPEGEPLQTLPDLMHYAGSLVYAQEEPGCYTCNCPILPGTLSQAEGSEGEDGPVAKVARDLNLSFLSDGSLSIVASWFKDFLKDSYGKMEETDLDRLTANWHTYIRNLYDPDDYGKELLDENGQPVLDSEGKPVTITDFYHILEDIKVELAEWSLQIIQARDQLPVCVMGEWDTSAYSENDVCVACDDQSSCPVECIAPTSNLPCKFSFDAQDGSLDAAYTPGADEIKTALSDLETISVKISEFQEAIKSYVGKMQQIYEDSASKGGYNPAVYSWSDSRCPSDPATGQLAECHSVSVETGPYKLARTTTTESGGFLSSEICINLVDYYDNGENCWVSVTKKGPKDKEVKSGEVSLGSWNPLDTGTVTKKGYAYYSYGKVGMAKSE